MRTWFLKVFEQEPVRELCGEKHDFTVPLTVEVLENFVLVIGILQEKLVPGMEKT